MDLMDKLIIKCNEYSFTQGSNTILRWFGGVSGISQGNSIKYLNC